MTVKGVIVLAAVLGATGWYFTRHRTAEPEPLPLLVERDSANFRWMATKTGFPASRNTVGTRPSVETIVLM
jgi:hypothetical protein